MAKKAKQCDKNSLDYLTYHGQDHISNWTDSDLNAAVQEWSRGYPPSRWQEGGTLRYESYPKRTNDLQKKHGAMWLDQVGHQFFINVDPKMKPEWSTLHGGDIIYFLETCVVAHPWLASDGHGVLYERQTYDKQKGEGHLGIHASPCNLIIRVKSPTGCQTWEFGYTMNHDVNIKHGKITTDPGMRHVWIKLNGGEQSEEDEQAMCNYGCHIACFKPVFPGARGGTIDLPNPGQPLAAPCIHAPQPHQPLAECNNAQPQGNGHSTQPQQLGMDHPNMGAGPSLTSALASQSHALTTSQPMVAAPATQQHPGPSHPGLSPLAGEADSETPNPALENHNTVSHADAFYYAMAAKWGGHVWEKYARNYRWNTAADGPQPLAAPNVSTDFEDGTTSLGQRTSNLEMPDVSEDDELGQLNPHDGMIMEDSESSEDEGQDSDTTPERILVWAECGGLNDPSTIGAIYVNDSRTGEFQTQPLERCDGHHVQACTQYAGYPYGLVPLSMLVDDLGGAMWVGWGWGAS